MRDITALQPNSILWDLEVRGFCARRQFSNVVTYSVIFRNADGRQHWFKLGRHPILTPSLARTEAIRVLRSVTLGDDPAFERRALRSAPTMAEICNEYVADMDARHINGKKASTVYTDKSRIKKYIAPQLGKLKVASVTQSQIEDFMHQLSPGSAKRIIGLTGAIFTYAIKKGLRETNPVRGIETPNDNKRLRRLSVVEYAQLGNVLADGSNAAADIFLLLAVTGFRSGEARLLKWSECDLDRRIVTLADLKTGQSVRPLSGAALEIIQRQQRTSEYVFALQQGAPINKLFHHWENLKMPKDVTPHVLRHSFASLGADMGISDHLIAGLLGHAGRGITSRYLHLSDKALIETADKVAQETLRLMQAR